MLKLPTLQEKMTDLFENNNDQRKLALKDKLQSIKMQKIESIPQYRSKFTQCHDELGGIGVKVSRRKFDSSSFIGSS